MRNYSYENDFYLHGNETAGESHFHMKGFALRFALKTEAQENSKMAYCMSTSAFCDLWAQQVMF